MTKLIY